MNLWEEQLYFQLEGLRIKPRRGIENHGDSGQRWHKQCHTTETSRIWYWFGIILLDLDAVSMSSQAWLSFQLPFYHHTTSLNSNMWWAQSELSEADLLPTYSQLQTATGLFLDIIDYFLCFLGIHINRIICVHFHLAILQYIMFLKFFHNVSCINDLLPFIAGCNSIEMPKFVYLFTNGWTLSCFQTFANMKKAAINIHIWLCGHMS